MPENDRGAVVVAGIAAVALASGLLVWGVRRLAPPEELPPPEERRVAGELSGVAVLPLGQAQDTALEGVTMERNLGLQQAAEIARRGFALRQAQGTAHPAVSITAGRDFYVAGTATNTGNVRATFYVVTEARGPLIYRREGPDRTLDPGQAVGASLNFIRADFGVAAWQPGTYTINVRLFEAATNRLLDEVNLPGELVITTAPPPAEQVAGKLSGVAVLPL